MSEPRKKCGYVLCQTQRKQKVRGKYETLIDFCFVLGLKR